MFPLFLLSLACSLGVSAPVPALNLYSLATVGGQPLPALWQETELVGGGNLRAWWVSGEASFCNDKTYHIALTLRTTGPGVLGQPVVVTMTGTWEKTGRDGRLVVRPARGGQVHWQLRGDTLAVRARVTASPTGTIAPSQFVFVRREP
jgi:hypothetical protein